MHDIVLRRSHRNTTIMVNLFHSVRHEQLVACN